MHIVYVPYFFLLSLNLFVSVNSYFSGQRILQRTALVTSTSMQAKSNKDLSNVPSHYQQRGKDSITKWITHSLGGTAIATGALLAVPSISQARLVADAAPSRYPIIGSDDIMRPKAHGTSEVAVQSKLRWNCDISLADKICNYNRHWAEMAGYWLSTNFLKEVEGGSQGEITFYDSVTGRPLFIAPKGRSFQDWRAESTVHGWPSFRDEEVVWENVRALSNGETVSLTGTHLGHNLPDRYGNRYCINLVSIAGLPVEPTTATETQQS